MKKIIILIPVFNDWESLIKLINEINKNINHYKNIDFEFLIVNDASTINKPEFIKPNNIKSFQILNMRENRGHARCNAFGIRYIFKNKEFDNVILMDGDGEDRPIEIKNLIDKDPNLSPEDKQQIHQQLVELYKLEVEDRDSARQREVEITKAGGNDCDALGDHVDVLAVGCIEALARRELAHLLHHNATLEAGVLGDLLERSRY